MQHKVSVQDQKGFTVAGSSGVIANSHNILTVAHTKSARVQAQAVLQQVQH